MEIPRRLLGVWPKIKITFSQALGPASLTRMKTPFRCLGLAVGLLGCALGPLARAQSTDLELQGVTTSQNKTEALLVQKSTGAGRWVAVGQTYAGYTLTVYDAPSGQLTLTKDRKTLVLTLKQASVQAAQTTEVTPPTPEEKKALFNNLRQLGAAADQYFLEQGVNKVDVAKLVGPNSYIRELKPVAGETYTGLIIEQGKAFRIKTSGGFEMEFTP